MSFDITPVASGYQEIQPYSAMNIDSVKINISLIMMKECKITEMRELIIRPGHHPHILTQSCCSVDKIMRRAMAQKLFIISGGTVQMLCQVSHQLLDVLTSLESTFRCDNISRYGFQMR